MKENILNDAKKGCGDTTISSNETTGPTIKSGNETTSPTTNLSNETTSSTDNSSNETTSVTNTTTTRSNDTYVYGDGIIAVLAIGVCVFFAYDTFQPEKLINEKKISHNDFMSIKTYIINEYFNWKKSTEDSLKDGLIMTATTAGIYYALKAANVKPPKASMDAMDIMKLAGGNCAGVLVKDYAVYKKSINE